MVHKGIYLLVSLVVAASQLYGSGMKSDTIPLPGEIRLSNFEKNLDSLVHLWYVRQSVPDERSEMVEDVEDVEVIAEFPDSVYIDRLSRIPSLLELSYNRIVRNYIHVYTKKKKENLEIMLGLSDYYFPIFEDIFDYYDLPVELKYMSVIESALNPRAVSRVGATGLWQFMYGTGRMYGLTINSIVDERRDPIKSTHAAAKFLTDLYHIYQDWTLVIAAYNCGPGNVNKAIRRSGNKRNYWDIYYFLPRETRGYVPAFIAATYVMNYYQEHNLKAKPIEIPLAVDTLMIHDDLHLSQVAEVLNIPVKQLRDMNPQYRRDIIPGKSRDFSLKLPVEYASAFIDLQDTIFAFKDSIYFNQNYKITNPVRSSYVPQPPSGKTKLYYTVQPGDNPGYIASWYHIGLSQLRYWNNIRSLIRVGQKLVVYVPPEKADYYRKINSMTFEEKQESIGKSTARKEEQVLIQEAPDSDYIYYKVKYGDTIWDIAKKYPGVTDTDIMRLNNLGINDHIHPGQQIKIKRKS
ncbi:MAG: transglycosylase SLT domain-containing protein [Bacteroidales bacterium]|nr:MAG: transglycosylase SLT domain-containing protein [Bacteroidales bacterium]